MEHLRTILRVLLRRKIRTLSAVLSVMLGVASITAVQAVGEGARQEAVRSIEALGTDTLVVRRLRPANGSRPRSAAHPASD